MQDERLVQVLTSVRIGNDAGNDSFNEAMPSSTQRAAIQHSCNTLATSIFTQSN
jgi:hypothetical protein